MSKVITVYLAGKMAGLTKEEMSEWRKEATKLISSPEFRTLDPIQFYNFDNVETLKASGREIMDFDLAMVRNSDIILVNLDHPGSIGTAIELYEAHDILKKPVIGFGTKENHDWVEACITKKFETLEEAVDYIHDFYGRLYIGWSTRH